MFSIYFVTNLSNVLMQNLSVDHVTNHSAALRIINSLDQVGSAFSSGCVAPRLGHHGEEVEEAPGDEVHQHNHHPGQLLVWSSAGWRD